MISGYVVKVPGWRDSVARLSWDKIEMYPIVKQ